MSSLRRINITTSGLSMYQERKYNLCVLDAYFNATKTIAMLPWQENESNE